MPGAQCTRSLVCEVGVQDAHEYSQRSHRKSPGIPARNGFNGFLRALPGDRAFLSPSLADTSANLTPASRRQDHTTSPSARRALSSEAPLASTASRPAFRDDRDTPLEWGGTARYKSDLVFRKTGIFFQTGLDNPNHVDPAHEIGFYAQIRRDARGRLAARMEPAGRRNEAIGCTATQFLINSPRLALSSKPAIFRRGLGSRLGRGTRRARRFPRFQPFRR
jgi:hypothetical protein